MLRSSLGFHTMTLSLRLAECEMYQLLNDFIGYNEKTGFLLMYRKNENGIYIKYYQCYSEIGIIWIIPIL